MAPSPDPGGVPQWRETFAADFTGSSAIGRAAGLSEGWRRYGSPKVLTRNTAIWPRLFGDDGQKLPLPQPAVTPSAASCSIQSENRLGQATSPKTPAQGGGEYVGPCSAFRRNADI